MHTGEICGKRDGACGRSGAARSEETHEYKNERERTHRRMTHLIVANPFGHEQVVIDGEALLFVERDDLLVVVTHK